MSESDSEYEYVIIDMPEFSGLQWPAENTKFSIDDFGSKNPRITLDNTYKFEGLWDESIGTNVLYSYNESLETIDGDFGETTERVISEVTPVGTAVRTMTLSMPTDAIDDKI